MDKNSTYEQIEAYLLQKMSSSERTKFEADLLSNTDLAKQFQEQELEHKMMETLVEKDLLKNLKQWQSEEDAVVDTPTKIKSIPAPIPLYRRRSSWAIAASILLLLSAVFWMNQKAETDLPIVDVDPKTNPPTEIPTVETTTPEDPPKEEMVTNETPKTEKEKIENITPKVETPKVEKPTVNYIALANNYTDPIRFKTNIRGEASELNNYKEALSYLEQKEFELGIAKLSELLTTTPNENIRYNLALAYYQQKKFAQAIPFFTEVIKNEYLQMDQAQWFLALSYLQVESIEKAQEILSEILADPDHPKYKKAVALKKELGF